MNEPLIVRTSCDLLHHIPETLGYCPADSVVIMPIAGHGGRVLLRFDLPAPGQAEQFAGAMLGYVLRLHDVDGVLIAVFTSCSYDDHGHPPHRDLIDALGIACRRAGLPLRGAACRAADGWGDYEEPKRHGTQAAPPRPSLTVAERTRIATADVAHRDGLAAALDRTGPEPADPAVVRLAWETRLDGDLALTSETLLAIDAVLLRALNDVDGVGALLFEATFGRLDAAQLARAGAALAGAEGYPFASADLRGIDIAAGEPIDRARMGRAVTVVRELIAGADPGWHEGPFAALAWLSWALGEASVAAAYADRALERRERGHVHPVANLVADLTGRGIVPSWFGVTGCDPGPAPGSGVTEAGGSPPRSSKVAEEDAA